MDTFNLWNKFNIQCKKISFIACFLLSNLCLNAQKSQSINYSHYDNKKINYGFVFAGHYDNFIVSHPNGYRNAIDYNQIRGAGGSGYTLGFIFNYHINEITDFRILPSIGFYERKIAYYDSTLSEENNVSELFESTFIELPIMMKFKSVRRGNDRTYFVLGIKPSTEVGANKKKVKETKLITQSKDLTIELGIGKDIYFPYFKFSPELRFSLGLVNMIERDNLTAARYIKRMPSYSVGLYFLFE